MQEMYSADHMHFDNLMLSACRTETPYRSLEKGLQQSQFSIASQGHSSHCSLSKPSLGDWPAESAAQGQDAWDPVLAF